MLTGALPSTTWVSVSVSSGGWVSNSTRARAVMRVPVAMSSLARAVQLTKPAPVSRASLGRSRPRVLSRSTSPVSGSIAWITQAAEAGFWNRSIPAETRSTKPRVAEKSMSWVKLLRPEPTWMVMSPTLMSPRVKLRASRLGSSWVTIRISFT